MTKFMINKDGATFFYLNGNTWFRPAYGGSRAPTTPAPDRAIGTAAQADDLFRRLRKKERTVAEIASSLSRAGKSRSRKGKRQGTASRTIRSTLNQEGD